MSPVDRRAFLRGVAMATAATAGAQVVVRDAFAAGRSSTILPEAAPAWTRAPCRLCGVGCGLLVGADSGRLVGVKGDPDAPVGKGLACAKGYYSIRALAGRDRLSRALVRRDGALVPVPLAEALDLVARRLSDTVRRFGKDSVAVYGSAQWSITDAYLAGKLFKGALGTDNVDTSGRLYAAGASAGIESTVGLDGAIGGYEDIEHADVLVLWDVNLAETDPVLFSRLLDRRRRNPAVRIVEVATRTTRTSYAADHSLLHVPHTVIPIANAICQEIVARNWVDHVFVDQHVAFKRGRTGIGNGTDADALVADAPEDATWAEVVSFLADYRPERVQELSGLATEDIRWLASLYGDPLRKVMSIWGPEVHRDIRGTWANNALYNIHLLVGKLADPGNNAFATTGQPSGGWAVHDAGARTGALPRGTVTSANDRQRAAEIWGLPQDGIPTTPSVPALSLFRRFERGEIRALWVLGTDPMVSLPNVDRYRRAAAGADRFLVVSEAYPTPTTDLADVVLPAAMWCEREVLYGNAERRIQYAGRVVSPPGEATSDAWQMIEIARRLGFQEAFAYDPSQYVAQIWEEYRRFHDTSETSLPPLDGLREQAGLRWPYVNGRETGWRYNAALDPAVADAEAGFDFYGHDDHRAWLWLRPHEAAVEAPDQTYPFWLTTGRVLEHWGTGTMTQRIPLLHRALPHSYVEIHREDASQLGIRNREIVRVVSRRGAIEVEARIDYRSQPPRGSVFIPAFDEGHPVNRLTLDAVDPLSGQPDGGKCAVRLERVGP